MKTSQSFFLKKIHGLYILHAMEYKNIVKGKFISRPNRFVAQVETNGETVLCHVKNTGRCKELLIPGVTVYMEDFSGRMGNRKLQYSLICVAKEKNLVNIDSQAPNKVVSEALQSGAILLPGMNSLEIIKGEHVYGNSRLDFYTEDVCGQKGLVEVKGVTLEKNGTAMFPDAPTQRGLRHVEELCKAASCGYQSYIIFVIQMSGVSLFMPNYKTHPSFGEALKKAASCGVHILCYDCLVTPDSIAVYSPIDYRL